MKTIELNEQAVDWLAEHLHFEMEERGYSNTSKGIMNHVLQKLIK